MMSKEIGQRNSCVKHWSTSRLEGSVGISIPRSDIFHAIRKTVHFFRNSICRLLGASRIIETSQHALTRKLYCL